MLTLIYILINKCITIIVYILSVIVVWYSPRYVKKKIKIEVNHAGNQEIPEFYDNEGNKKCITFEISEDSTIGEVKDEIAKQVKYVDRSISLFKKPFGKKLLNSTNIICFHNTEPLYLYIVIPNY
jgi:hypothetical protein